MDIEKLAFQAADIIDNVNWHITRMHGIEVARGFFNIYNVLSSQSRVVLYHPKSDLIFKQAEYVDDSASNRYLGEVVLEGVTYRVRHPKVQYVDCEWVTIEVQEYVRGRLDPCLENTDERYGMVDCWCHHARMLGTQVGVLDTHSGNWKIVGNEIVIFDS